MPLGREKFAQVRALLADGADARAVSYSGWTAVHGAAECGSVGCITRLAAAGADMSAVASSGKTPLDIARQYSQPAAASALLGFGAAVGEASPRAAPAPAEEMTVKDYATFFGCTPTRLEPSTGSRLSLDLLLTRPGPMSAQTS